MPLDSVAATFMDRTQSGFSEKLKNEVFPVFVRNIIGWKIRQARAMTAIAVRALSAASIMIRPKSFRQDNPVSAKLINTAGASTTPSMARLTLQLIVIPRNSPNRSIAAQPARFI